MFMQNMQQERTLQTALAELSEEVQKLHNVDPEQARKLLLDALDSLNVWTIIMEDVAQSIERQQEAKEAAKEDAHYAKLRGE